MSFQIIENDNSVFLDGGMSSEIAFAKYYAYKKNMVYSGWNNNIRKAYPEIFYDTLNYVIENIKKLEYFGCQKPVLMAPGFISIPYITELCDMVYLPSQFLIGFNSFKDIKELLRYIFEEIGIRAYAVCGYDGCIPNCLVAWIKFMEMPKIYMDLIENYLHSDKIILGGVFSKDNKTSGENFIFKYDGSNLSDKDINSCDVYLLHINACYGMKPEKDWEIFNNLTDDFLKEKVIQKKVPQVGDWESSFDFLRKEFVTHRYDKFPNVYLFSSRDTTSLYEISYSLSKKFIKMNNIFLKGVVFNPYFINNPIYEVNYGYIGCCYWIRNKNLTKLILEKIQKDVISNHGEIWFNDQSNQIKPFFDTLEYDKKIIINNTSSLCFELGGWIKKHKPDFYKNYDFISVFQLIQILKTIEGIETEF